MSASSAVWNSLMKRGARRVHRPEADEPLAKTEPRDERHDPLGQIDQLDPLIRLDQEGLPDNPESANRHG